MTTLLNDDYDFLPSTLNGSTLIEHIELAGIERENTIRRGKLPLNMGFYSDHRAIFTDLETKKN